MLALNYSIFWSIFCFTLILILYASYVCLLYFRFVENHPIDLEAMDPLFLRWFCHRGYRDEWGYRGVERVHVTTVMYQHLSDDGVETNRETPREHWSLARRYWGGHGSFVFELQMAIVEESVESSVKWAEVGVQMIHGRPPLFISKFGGLNSLHSFWFFMLEQSQID
jgi:hypothetical protein